MQYYRTPPVTQWKIKAQWSVTDIWWLVSFFFFFFFFFWPHHVSTWDLNSPTRDRTCPPCIGRHSLNHWTSGGEVHVSWFQIYLSIINDYILNGFRFFSTCESSFQNQELYGNMLSLIAFAKTTLEKQGVQLCATQIFYPFLQLKLPKHSPPLWATIILQVGHPGKGSLGCSPVSHSN